MNSTLRLRIIGIVMLGIPLALAAIGVSFFQYREQVANTALMERAGEVAGSLDQIFAMVLLASNRSRAFTLRGNLPIIFTSGFPAGPQDFPAVGWLEAEATVLAKPVRRQDLAEHVRRALESVAPAPA